MGLVTRKDSIKAKVVCGMMNFYAFQVSLKNCDEIKKIFYKKSTTLYKWMKSGPELQLQPDCYTLCPS